MENCTALILPPERSLWTFTDGNQIQFYLGSHQLLLLMQFILAMKMVMFMQFRLKPEKRFGRNLMLRELHLIAGGIATDNGVMFVNSAR